MSPEGGEEPKLRYDRSARLAKAPPEARWLIERQARGKPAFLKDLLGNRPLMLLFVTIVIAIVFVNLFAFLDGIPGKARLGSYSLAAEAFRFEGRVYVTVTAYAPLRGGPGGELTIASEDGGAVLVSENLPLSGSRDYRFTLPETAENPERMRLKVVSGTHSTVIVVTAAGH